MTVKSMPLLHPSHGVASDVPGLLRQFLDPVGVPLFQPVVAVVLECNTHLAPAMLAEKVGCLASVAPVARPARDWLSVLPEQMPLVDGQGKVFVVPRRVRLERPGCGGDAVALEGGRRNRVASLERRLNQFSVFPQRLRDPLRQVSPTGPLGPPHPLDLGVTVGHELFGRHLPRLLGGVDHAATGPTYLGRGSLE